MKYLLRKLAYALRGYHYIEDSNGYCVSDGKREFGVSFRPTTPEPED